MIAERTVFIVDDDPGLLDSLAEMVMAMGLQPACYADASEFLTTFDPSRPGCLVLDVRLPGMCGLELQEELAARGSRLPVIMITGHGDVATGVRAMKQGAYDFLEKPYSPQQLRDTIRHAVDLDAQRRDGQAREAVIQAKLARLTSEESKVASMTALGYTNKEISSELALSLRTIQFRRASVMEKLEVKSRTQLVELLLLSNTSPASQL